MLLNTPNYQRDKIAHLAERYTNELKISASYMKTTIQFNLFHTVHPLLGYIDITKID